MDINDKKITKFLSVIEEMTSIDILSDTKAGKYNKLYKIAGKLLLDIISNNNYKDLVYYILNKTNGDKYWQIHTNLMTGLVGIKDKYLSLEILKLYPEKNKLDIIDMENYLKKR